ncbi:MAG: hypothetical protein GY803_25340 [Chloroflexi bacterium]|nr:hypothetical protein [Chloroflexota bacterium]
MLIDNQFDVLFANQIAALETYNKHLYRPNTYLHKWWARRCGSTFRAILKHLVEDEAHSDYYAPGGLAGKIILDPMMGGGTTLHEAIRLGANVIGADLDPIPVLQARASLSQIPLADLEAAFTTFFDGLTAVLSPFYQTNCPVCETVASAALSKSVPLQYVLYGWRRSCACHEALFVDSTILRYNNDDTIISIDPTSHAILQDERVLFAPENTPALPLLARKIKRCADCGQPYREDLAKPYYQRYEPIAITGKCPTHGLFFAPPRPTDLAAIARADALREQRRFDAADFAVTPGPKSKSLFVRGIDNYLDLFSSRQLLYLQTAITQGSRGAEEQRGKVSPAHPLTRSSALLARLNLALLVSTSLEFNTMLCGYKGDKKRRPGAIRHAFAYHAYSFPYTALENNPIYPARRSGTLQGLFYGRIVRGRIWAANPVERRVGDGSVQKVTIAGEVDAGTEHDDFADLQTGSRRFLLLQGSSAALNLPDDSVDAIVTDPPYFDSVQYSDLAAFFRVWLRQLLPEAADWEVVQTESAVDRRVKDDQYGAVLAGIFVECKRVLKGDGRFIFTYHHWNPKGWAALTLALKQAGFILVNRYVVHAENMISRHIVGQNALQHDVILVLAPTELGAQRDWKRPSAIDTESSEGFTRDCGTAVGWALNHLPVGEIEAEWQSLLAEGW